MEQRSLKRTLNSSFSSPMHRKRFVPHPLHLMFSLSLFSTNSSHIHVLALCLFLLLFYFFLLDLPFHTSSFAVSSDPCSNSLYFTFSIFFPGQRNSKGKEESANHYVLVLSLFQTSQPFVRLSQHFQCACVSFLSSTHEFRVM